MRRNARRSPWMCISDRGAVPAGFAGPIAPVSTLVGILLLTTVLAGCRSNDPVPQTAVEAKLRGLHADTDVLAQCRPPLPWQPKPLEHFPRSVQRVWLSPTGRTAYGVIYIRLPLPVGPDLVLWRFIADMRDMEGDGRLISRERNGGGEIRFVAETPRYRFNARLHTASRNAWVIYAGVRRDEPPDAEEFSVAESARDATIPGLTTVNR